MCMHTNIHEHIYAHVSLPTYMYTCMHIYTIYVCHSSNNFVLAKQKANRLSSLLNMTYEIPQCNMSLT